MNFKQTNVLIFLKKANNDIAINTNQQTITSFRNLLMITLHHLRIK